MKIIALLTDKSSYKNTACDNHWIRNQFLTCYTCTFLFALRFNRFKTLNKLSCVRAYFCPVVRFPFIWLYSFQYGFWLQSCLHHSVGNFSPSLSPPSPSASSPETLIFFFQAIRIEHQNIQRSWSFRGTSQVSVIACCSSFLGTNIINLLLDQCISDDKLFLWPFEARL